MNPLSIPTLSEQKWALLIGINEYPRLPEGFQLKGCINDVNAIEELLISPQFAFPPEHILKLTSPASNASLLATRENILSAFRRHLVENDRIASGDLVVIYYSGHGSQVPDEEGDEEDGYDETIVPCDAGPDRSKREDVLDITDDQISFMLDQLVQRTRNINLIFDSCHSGTITRGLLDAEREDGQGRERYLPPATYQITPSMRTPATATREMGPSDWMPLSDGYVLISACMANERSREDRFSFWRREQHGILSYYLIQAMKDVGPETTYLDIWDQVRVEVNKRNRWQNPQIEGAFERKVFGGAALPRRRYVEVRGTENQDLILAAGLANGATVGSTFAIYPKDMEDFEDQTKRIARVKLTKVEAFTSYGTIQSGSLAGVNEGARAIEIEHDYGDMRMTVDVIGDHAALNEIREGIKTSNLLSLWTNNGSAPIARVRLRYPFDEKGNPATSESEKLFILSAGGGHPLVEATSSDENGPAIVKAKLEHIARYYNILTIHNPDQQSKLKGKIKLRLLKVIGKSENNTDLTALVERNEGGEINLSVGEEIIVEVENQWDKQVYLVLLNCDSSWGVKPFFPKAGAADSSVQPKSTRRVERLTVDLYEYQKPVKKNQPLPCEVIKAIATTEKIDFRSLWQPNTRFLDDEPDTSLNKLFARALGITDQRATRSLEEGSDQTVKDWTTSELVFHITTEPAP